MNGHFSISCSAAALLLLAGWTGPAAGSDPKPAADDSVAGELVQAALKTEFSRELKEGRDSLLGKAVSLAPDYAPARWHSGYVRIDGDWISLGEAQQRWSQDNRRAEYDKLRNAHAGNAAGELALARWCQKNGLAGQARAHWIQVLKIRPDHEEALKGLGMTWWEGQLLTREQVAQAKEAKQRFFSAKRRWEPTVTRWCRMVSAGESVLREELQRNLSGISDPVEMAALDQVIQDRCRGGKDASTHRALSLQVIAVVSGISRQFATESLVRHAVFHPMDEVRSAATSALKSRPMNTCAPMLLSEMATPIEAEFRLWEAGPVSHLSCRLYREGLQADWVSVLDETHIGAVSHRTSPLFRIWYARRAASAQAHVEAQNAVTTVKNHRVGHVLAQVTGFDFGAHPLGWWNWWIEHTEREMAENPAVLLSGEPFYQSADQGKPVYETRAYTWRLTASCFAKGTQVRTLAGMMPIEEIHVGDEVLSQDPSTGELAYKPVLETTLRRPTERIRISLPDEAIDATGGHPFWASGRGWQMAKELKAGTPLHSFSGAVPVEKVETVAPDKAWYDFSHNLVVADFGTYFVGESGLLVHDNTPEQPTDALVPGLLAP